MQFPFKKQMRVEVVDKTHLCRTRVALVEQVSVGQTDGFGPRRVSDGRVVAGDRRAAAARLRGVRRRDGRLLVPHVQPADPQHRLVPLHRTPLQTIGWVWPQSGGDDEGRMEDEGVCLFADGTKRTDGQVDAPGQLFAKVRLRLEDRKALISGLNSGLDLKCMNHKPILSSLNECSCSENVIIFSLLNFCSHIINVSINSYWFPHFNLFSPGFPLILT